MKKFIILLANSQRYFIHAVRVAIFISFILFAGAKAFSNHGDYISYMGVAVILIIGAMTLLGIWFHKIGLIGGLCIFLTSLAAIIFLSITIPRVLYAPYQVMFLLSSFGRLVVLMTAGLICASDSAKQIFRQYVLRMGRS